MKLLTRTTAAANAQELLVYMLTNCMILPMQLMG